MCAVRFVLRLWMSLLFCSSSSCIPTRTWRCLRFRSSTECFNFQLCFRGVYAQCKLCKSWSFHRAVLRRCLRALCCALTGAGADNREVSARVLGQGCLARCDAKQAVVLCRFCESRGVWRKVLSPRSAQAIILRTSYEVWLRMVQFLLFAVYGLGSRILLLGQGC